MGMTAARLALVGIDFRTAPVAVRERWSLDDAGHRRLVDAALDVAEELVVLRTCNRTEIVAWLRPGVADPGVLGAAWAAAVGAPETDAGPPVQVLRGYCGARHLLRVAAGLESQILGDIHILGQVRRGYRTAQDQGTVGPHLHRLFDAALRAGKRVRRETELMAGHRSVGSEAARHLLERLPPEAPRRVLVLGAGKVGSHAARALAATPGIEVVLLNRTASRAATLAAEWGGVSGGLDLLPSLLSEAGGVLVATGAPAPGSTTACWPTGRPDGFCPWSTSPCRETWHPRWRASPRWTSRTSTTCIPRPPPWRKPARMRFPAPNALSRRSPATSRPGSPRPKPAPRSDPCRSGSSRSAAAK
jgi:glutamyl-tRNA reductase